MGDIQASRVDVTTAAGPISPKLGGETKWRCFGARLHQGTENRGFNQIPNFFRRTISNNK